MHYMTAASLEMSDEPLFFGNVDADNDFFHTFVLFLNFRKRLTEGKLSVTITLIRL